MLCQEILTKLVDAWSRNLDTREERVKKKIKASLVLDEFGQDVSLKELPSTPSERNPEEVLEKSCPQKSLQNGI